MSVQRNPTTLGDQAAQLEEVPQPEKISEEDLQACGSPNLGVEYVISGEAFDTSEEDEGDEITEDNSSDVGLTEEEKLASDTLVVEFCGRPELVRNMSSAHDPGITLVAFGCDAASGKIGDADLQNSLRSFEQTYCNSATEAIEFEADFLIESAQSFKTETIPVLKQQIESQDNSGNSTNVIQNAESILDLTIETANEAKDLLSSGSTYGAAISLDKAITMYNGMIESDEMSMLLGIEDIEEE